MQDREFYFMPIMRGEEDDDDSHGEAPKEFRNSKHSTSGPVHSYIRHFCFPFPDERCLLHVANTIHLS